MSEVNEVAVTLEVTLTADEANAVVEALCLATVVEGDLLGHARSDSPGDLMRLGSRAARIGAFAELGKALQWRKHWGPLGGTPEAVTASEAVWVDLLCELQKRAAEIRAFGADPSDRYEFDAAARTVARAFAGAETVAA